MAINMGRKVHTLLFNAAQGGQAKHLEAARVCQYGTVPSHELMQPSQLFDNRVGWTKMQVVGIGQLYLAADLLQIFGAERAFDGPLCTDVHKHRGLNHTMGTGKLSASGFSFSLF